MAQQDQGEKEKPMQEIGGRLSQSAGAAHGPDSCFLKSLIHSQVLWEQEKREDSHSLHCMLGAKAEEILEKGLKVREYGLRRNNSSDTGNFGFGIQEHVDLGMKYDPSVGSGLSLYTCVNKPNITKTPQSPLCLIFHRKHKFWVSAWNPRNLAH
uniref:Large ribosomal subunit protein uL5 C-terminal domain-containing protein n=1 Tax=Podarcis muralis TaxID=64176 RepID=A0A670JHZ3_PODMU